MRRSRPVGFTLLGIILAIKAFRRFGVFLGSSPDFTSALALLDRFFLVGSMVLGTVTALALFGAQRWAARSMWALAAVSVAWRLVEAVASGRVHGLEDLAALALFYGMVPVIAALYVQDRIRTLYPAPRRPPHGRPAAGVGRAGAGWWGARPRPPEGERGGDDAVRQRRCVR
jgi:hypothetical protein